MFVENNDMMTVEVYYRKSGGGSMKVVRSLEGIADGQKAEFKKLIVTLAPMSWKRYNEAQRASMVDKGKGEEMDWLLYREKKLLAIMKAWDAQDAKGTPIPVTPDNIFKLHPMIAETILNEYDRVTFLGEDERKNS